MLGQVFFFFFLELALLFCRSCYFMLRLRKCFVQVVSCLYFFPKAFSKTVLFLTDDQITRFMSDPWSQKPGIIQGEECCSYQRNSARKSANHIGNSSNNSNESSSHDNRKNNKNINNNKVVFIRFLSFFFPLFSLTFLFFYFMHSKQKC